MTELWQNLKGFIVPSAHFGVVVAQGETLPRDYVVAQTITFADQPLSKILWCADYFWAKPSNGLVHVVNPGRHRIESYLDGHFEGFWGKPENSAEGFCGCCNPVALAMLPDQRFITAEKFIPRVKVYSADGKFVGVVAGAEVFAPNAASLEETRRGISPSSARRSRR